MAPSVSKWIFRAENESGFKDFPSRHVFSKKQTFKAFKAPCVFLSRGGGRKFKQKKHPRPGIIKCVVLLKVLKADDYEYVV